MSWRETLPTLEPLDICGPDEVLQDSLAVTEIFGSAGQRADEVIQRTALIGDGR